MADSVHEAILDAIGAKLATLSLDGVQERVQECEVLDDTWLLNAPEMPCLIYGGVGIEEEAIDNVVLQMDDWWYPAVIRIVERRDAAQDPSNRKKRLKWRKIIKRTFHHQRLVGVDEVSDCLFKPSPMVEPEPLAFELFVTPSVFAFRAREGRS
jgi:hypothetical protein